MKAEFWKERWETDQLGFHQTETNAHLKQFWAELEATAGATVFVPLCGKSLDMRWLRSIGHPVIGVEISPIAVCDFFKAAGIEAKTSASDGGLVRSSGGGYDLYCGDFFALEAHHLADVRAVYDRASLIALPPKMRERYAKHLAKALPATVSILLIALEYDPSRMQGPPHCVPASEIEALFGAAFEVERLWSSGPQEASEYFRARGLDASTTTVWRIERGTTHRWT
ncbi:MAG: thiopurine S-methyltransferase [Deltaproteobacteria bacterium]|nr:thiopurine S-methyltransferase [Deltaproteobacteria bacterium]